MSHRQKRRDKILRRRDNKIFAPKNKFRFRRFLCRMIIPGTRRVCKEPIRNLTELFRHLRRWHPKVSEWEYGNLRSEKY